MYRAQGEYLQAAAGMGAVAKPVTVNMTNGAWVQELKRAMNAVSPGAAGHTPVWYAPNGAAWATHVAPVLAPPGTPVSRLTTVCRLGGAQVQCPSPIGLRLLAQRLNSVVVRNESGIAAMSLLTAYPTLRQLLVAPARIYPLYSPSAAATTGSKVAQAQRGVGEYFLPVGMGEYFAANGMGEYFASNGLGADSTSEPVNFRGIALFGAMGAVAGLGIVGLMESKHRLRAAGLGALAGAAAGWATGMV